MTIEPRVPAVPPVACQDVSDLAAGFVLDALSPEDASAVREHLATCPQPHPEFAELGGVIPYLAESLDPVEPPVALRDRLVAAVSRESAARAARGVPSTDSVPTAAPIAAAPSAAPIRLEAERGRRRPILPFAAAIAAVLMVALLGAWNLQLRSQIDAGQSYQAVLDRVIAIAASPGGQAAVLSPANPGGPAGLAAVGADGSIALAMHGLDRRIGSAVYEAWFIGADQKPIAIGELALDASGNGVLASVRLRSEPGVKLALTREAHAGATVPTLPILSAGVATASGQG